MLTLEIEGIKCRFMNSTERIESSTDGNGRYDHTLIIKYTEIFIIVFNFFKMMS